MQIEDFTELYFRFTGERTDLAAFLTGHLAVEFLLRKLVLISAPSTADAERMGYYSLVQLNKKLGTITEQQGDVLEQINRIRNKFAHEISYDLTIEEIKDLFEKASGAFSDMTDGIAQGIDELRGANKRGEMEGWVIPELFAQITYDLHSEYQDRGGDMEMF